MSVGVTVGGGSLLSLCLVLLVLLVRTNATGVLIKASPSIIARAAAKRSAVLALIVELPGLAGEPDRLTTEAPGAGGTLGSLGSLGSLTGVARVLAGPFTRAGRLPPLPEVPVSLAASLAATTPLLSRRWRWRLRSCCAGDTGESGLGGIGIAEPASLGSFRTWLLLIERARETVRGVGCECGKGWG